MGRREKSKKSHNRRKYVPRTAEQVKKRATQDGSNRDSIFVTEVDTFTPKEKDNIVRVLPPTWEKPEHYGHDVYVHYGIGVEKSAYICPQKMDVGKCPICEERSIAEAEGEVDLAKDLRPSKRVAVYVIDRDDEDAGPKVWLMSYTMDKGFANISIDKRTGEILNVDCPDEGYDFEFTRSGTGLTTKYEGLTISRRSSLLGDDAEVVNEWLDATEEKELPDIFKIYDYDYLKDVFSGGVESSDDDDDAADADEDDADDEDDRALDRVAKKGSKAADDDDDDADDDAEDSLYSWSEIHESKFKALKKIIKKEDIDIDIDDYDEDDLDELADDVCDELGITKPTKKSRQEKNKESLRSRRDRG